MLAQLLSSKPKSKLINLFLAHPYRSFAPTELKLASGISNALLKKTLRELVKMEFLLQGEKKGIKYYQVNRHFALYPELLNLLNKNKSIPTDLLANAAIKASDCKIIILTGVFAGKFRIETDVLFVGKVNPRKLENFIKFAEKCAEQDITYTVLTPQEFDYRLSMNDRFLKNILENHPDVVLDKTKKYSMVR